MHLAAQVVATVRVASANNWEAPELTQWLLKKDLIQLIEQAVVHLQFGPG